MFQRSRFAPTRPSQQRLVLVRWTSNQRMTNWFSCHMMSSESQRLAFCPRDDDLLPGAGCDPAENLLLACRSVGFVLMSCCCRTTANATSLFSFTESNMDEAVLHSKSA